MFVEYADIVSIHKNKGSRLDIDNDREILSLIAFKKILDKMIYMNFYDEIDSNMSPYNIGARKGRNIRNHLFILYAIINSFINGKEAPIYL